MSETEISNPETTQQEIIDMLGIQDNDEFAVRSQAFVNSRINAFDVSTLESPPPRAISINSAPYADFITTDTELLPKSIGLGIKLDDPEAYAELMPALRSAFQQLVGQLPPKRAYVNAALYAANYAQRRYFGSVISGSEASAVREDLLFEYSSREDTPDFRSVAEFKSIAMCTERAAVAHNGLRILDIPSELHNGKLTTGDNQSELHTFIVTQTANGDPLLFDPTNPVLFYGPDGSLQNAVPALYPMNDESYQVGTETSVQVTHTDHRVDASGAATTESKLRTYELGSKKNGFQSK